MASTKSLGNLQAKTTAFFLCDVQERFRPAIHGFEDIVTVAKRLLDTSKILEIPLIVTEQYPKGLGHTVDELDIGHATCVVPKTKFSMLVDDVIQKLPSLCDGNLKHVVLFGIEAHVCIQQTVIDLLEKGFEVHVIADATSSRSQMDRKFAFERFQRSGAIVTTSEAVILQLVADKNHPKFKEIQSIIKTSAPTSGL